MKKKKTHKFLIFIIIIAIFVVGIIFYINNKKGKDSTSQVSEVQVENKTLYSTISSSSYISSALSEKLELHATYYLEEVFVEENQYVEEGQNILEYTNGTFMTAPYNCVIKSLKLPDVDGQCLNSHYVEVNSTDTLTMSVSVSEDKLSQVYVGQEAEIKVDVLSDKIYTGYVTNIGNTATYSSNGSNFVVTVEFQNDSNILIGMSATCDVILEKAENVLAVPVEAVIKSRNSSYVVVKNDDGTTSQTEIETGISNDAYIEVKSGLSGNETLIIEDTSSDTSSNGKNSGFDKSMIQQGGQMPSGMSFDMGGQIPSDFSGDQGGKMTTGAPSSGMPGNN